MSASASPSPYTPSTRVPGTGGAPAPAGMASPAHPNRSPAAAHRPGRLARDIATGHCLAAAVGEHLTLLPRHESAAAAQIRTRAQLLAGHLAIQRAELAAVSRELQGACQDVEDAGGAAQKLYTDCTASLANASLFLDEALARHRRALRLQQQQLQQQQQQQHSSPLQLQQQRRGGG